MSAYKHEGVEPHSPAHPQHFQATRGLTKRELFAAMAMQGLLAADDKADYETNAKWAVEHADALISELNKTT